MEYNSEVLKWPKVQDTTVSQSISATGSVYCLNLVGNGVEYFQRIGRIINIRALRLRFSIQPTAAATPMLDQRFRVCLVLDKQPNGGSLPVVADMLQQVSAISAERYDLRHRFVFLKDWFYQLGRTDSTATQAVSSSASYVSEDIYLKLNLNTVYGSTSAVLAPESGALILFAISSSIPDSAAISFNSRIYFTDS